MKSSNNIFWKLIKAIALLPLSILLYGVQGGGRSFERMQADHRIQVESKRGIVTVDASGKYNCLR